MSVGAQWTSAHCVHKVEEMIGRAIRQQEDLWDMLVTHSPEAPPSDDSIEGVHRDDSVPLHLRNALQAKLENSLDWCHLALCRLQEIVAHSTPFPSPSPRLPIPSSSDHGLETKLNRDGDEDDTSTVSVVFQELKPGDDTRKGIPDDGHRSWKKYGNKTILNSHFCRGYYRCSMWGCRAKKMVQLTDENPAVFEVTYVGRHSCARGASRRRPKRPPASPPGARDARVQRKVARPLNPGSLAIAKPSPSPTQPESAALEKTSHELHESKQVDAGADGIEGVGDFDAVDGLGLGSFEENSLLWQEILGSRWGAVGVEI